MEFDSSKIGRGAALIVEGLGVDGEDENFSGTPDRIVRALAELCRGLYNLAEIEAILAVTFPTSYDKMIAVANIETVGLCPHHLLPVEYTVHVGYIPGKGKPVLGASKIPRLVELLAARPVLQEQLTDDIARILEERLEPEGVMVVVIVASHACMRLRGVGMGKASLVTSAVRGSFYEAGPKDEFLKLVLNGGEA
jgi:GTP cyclohydrolase I